MKRFLISFLFLFGLTGCGTYSHSVQVDDDAYLLLTGDNFQGHFLTIDGGDAIDLFNDVKPFDLNGKNAIKIKIRKGTHTVQIINNDGVAVVDRKFYVSTGSSFEVQL